MIVVFTPSKSGALRQYRSTEIVCDKAGEYEVSNGVGVQLCADFPDNFKPASGTKNSSAPTHNRAAKSPKKNKGA